MTYEQVLSNRALTARPALSPGGLASRAMPVQRPGSSPPPKKTGIGRTSKPALAGKVTARSPKAMSSEQLALVNAKRKKTRNSWSDDDCVKRPDSQRAGHIKAKTGGNGSGPARKWC